MGTKQTKLNMAVLLAVVLAMGSVAYATAPIVNGGEDQTMYPGETIELQGTASDPVTKSFCRSMTNKAVRSGVTLSIFHEHLKMPVCVSALA